MKTELSTHRTIKTMRKGKHKAIHLVNQKNKSEHTEDGMCFLLLYIRCLDYQICWCDTINTFCNLLLDSSNVKFKCMAKRKQWKINPFWAWQQALCTSLPLIDILGHRPNAEGFLKTLTQSIRRIPVNTHTINWKN